MEKKLEEVNKKCEEIEKNLILLEDRLPKLHLYIQSLGEGINAVNISFQRVNEGIEKRQFLMDLQCHQGTFSGLIHEEYHSVTEQLSVEFDIYLSSIKTMLNRLPNLIQEIILDHREKRDIVFKSFGPFIKSLEKKEFTKDSLRNLKDVLLEYGKKIDQINDYRDKKIEHVHKPSLSGLISDNKGARRYHLKPAFPKDSKEESIEAFKKKIELLPRGKRTVAVKVELEGGGHIDYVHMQSDRKIGEPIRAGDKVGYISDGNNGHFKKYGPHGHIFTHPKEKEINFFHPEASYESPSAYESLTLLTNFLNKTIKLIVSHVEKIL